MLGNVIEVFRFAGQLVAILAGNDDPVSGPRACQLRMLFEASLQSMGARYQAVVRVRKRESRGEGKGFLAVRTAATANRNPIVMFVMHLLGAAPVVVN